MACEVFAITNGSIKKYKYISTGNDFTDVQTCTINIGSLNDVT